METHGLQMGIKLDRNNKALFKIDGKWKKGSDLPRRRGAAHAYARSLEEISRKYMNILGQDPRGHEYIIRWNQAADQLNIAIINTAGRGSVVTVAPVKR